MKINTKNPKFNLDFRNLSKGVEKTDWQKILYLATLVSFVFVVVAYLYLIIRPTPKDIQRKINEEISASDIKFNEKTLQNLMERQNPPQKQKPETGKNPFSPF